jgi:pimeloyl-ACP methyl ester carboxylesterase
MQLVYIHGASATSDSFNYLRTTLGDGICINYDSRNGFENNLSDMLDTLKNVNNIVFVAHSLGGIYALHIANALPKQVAGAVTLSTPYGGSEIADVAKYFLPFSQLMRDIGPNSRVMKQASRFKIQHPWTNVVTVRGQSPFIVHPNDGVVTIESQRRHKGMELVDVNCNHYEVLLSNTVSNIIKERYRIIKESRE